MFWNFPLKIPTLDTLTNETSYVVFDTKEDFVVFMKEQFKVPGQYNLKNTIRWQDAGQQYSKTVTKPNFEGGYYTKAIRKTHKWKQYWSVEKEKVLNGIIIDGVYLPPFYYWYLNYCPIYNAVLNKKMFGFVWDSDLWFFQYIMMCLLLGKHAVVVKARQRGYSFKIMAILYWSYSWIEGSVNTIGAYKEDFTLKSWRFLEFYRKHLNSKACAWKRGPVMPKSLEWVERTYLTDGGYVGQDSKLVATTFKQSPENGVGGSQTIFFYEEAGIAPTLLKTVGYVRPALERGTKTTGLIILSGAVGDLDDCQDLKEVFYNPHLHNFLGIPNIWDKKSGYDTCGLFVGEQYNLEGFIDEEGNSLVDEALAWIEENNEKVRLMKKKELAQLDISQKPTSPEMAFAQRKDSEFPSDLLARQQERILQKYRGNRWKFKPIKCLLYEDDNGKVCMNTSDLPPEHEYPIKPEWEDKRGVVTIYEPPDSQPKWLVNFAGVDTVEVDFTETSHSVMSVDIYKRACQVRYKDEKGKIQTRIEGGKIVATYRGRFNPVEKGNEQAWLLIKMYNALTYVERSKPNFINYMKRHGRAEHYLAKEADVPIHKDLNLNANLSSSNYGFIIPSKKDNEEVRSEIWRTFKSYAKEYFAREFGRLEKSDGELLRFITGIDKIDDYWTLEEFIRYNNKDNFDRIISFCAAVTIGTIYENNLGIATVDEVKEVPKEESHQPRQHRTLLGSYRTGSLLGKQSNRSLIGGRSKYKSRI